MLSRRELIAAGVAGGLAGPAAEDTSMREVAQDADRAGQREIATQIQNVDSTLKAAFLTSSVIARLRGDMETFLRANSKFPDYFEVGVAVFYEIYDWHIKNEQPIVVTRLSDGRYALQFMFSNLVLRPDQDRNFIGVPSDRL